MYFILRATEDAYLEAHHSTYDGKVRDSCVETVVLGGRFDRSLRTVLLITGAPFWLQE